MWQQSVSKLLYKSGWGSGFRIPIANAENLELERELEKRHRLIQIKQAELEDLEKHATTLKTALKNSSDHIAHESKLTNAKTSEIAAEQELLKIADEDCNHLTRECKASQDAFNKAAKKNRDIVAEIRMRKQDLDELTELIEYDRKELAVIENRATDESQILAAIEEIGDQDAEAMKKYETRYRKATAETGNLRLELEGKISLTRVMQTELDGIGDRFRKLHHERGQIVHMWKDTMTALTQRDTEMNNIAEVYQQTDSMLKSATAKVELERSKLKLTEQSGTSALMQLNKWDRKVSDIREEIKSLSEYKQSLKDNILTYEIGISLASTQTQELTSKSSAIDKELSEMNSRVAAAHSQISELQVKAEESSKSILSVSERMAQIQALVSEEGKKLECLQKNLEREVLRKGRWLGKKMILEQSHTHLEMQVRAANAGLQTFVMKGKDAMMTLEKRKASIYCIELEVISAQLKYKPALNPKLVENSRGYEEAGRRVIEMKMELGEISKRKSFVLNQVNHITHINRRIYREKGNLDKEIERLDVRNNEHRCEVKFSTKSLELMVDQYQTAIVDNSLIKLKLRQLTKFLQEEKDMLCDTASKRAILESAIKEKRSEIDAHSRLLEAKRRVLKDELSQLKMQFCNASSCLVKRRQRYEITMKLMATSDEKGKEVVDIQSEAYYVLKMVQEREMLKQEGDNWDRKVKEAEIETEALQNSLSLIKCSNDMFKDSLKPVADDDCLAEINKLKKLEKDYLYRKNRAINNLRKLRADIPIKIEAIEVSKHQTSNESNKAMDKEYNLRVLTGDLRNQAMSGKRVRMMTLKLLRGLTFAGEQEKELVSRDIKLKATRRKFEFAIQAVAKLLNVHPFMYEMIGKFLSKQFGEVTAIKFLNRVISDISSPTGSQTGIGTRRSSVHSTVSLSRGASALAKPSVRATKSVESVKFSTASFVPMSRAQSAASTIMSKASVFSTLGGAPSSAVVTPKMAPGYPIPPILEDGGTKFPVRTVSENEVLHNIGISVASNRQQVVESRKKQKELELELLQKQALAKEESATDMESMFYNPMQQSTERFDESPSGLLFMPKKEELSDSEVAKLSRSSSTSSEGKEKSPDRLDSISESPELGGNEDEEPDTTN